MLITLQRDEPCTNPFMITHNLLRVFQQSVPTVQSPSSPSGSESGKKVRRKLPPIPAGVEPVSAATRRARHAQHRSKSMEERRRPPDLNGDYTKDGTPAKDLISKRMETSRKTSTKAADSKNNGPSRKSNGDTRPNGPSKPPSTAVGSTSTTTTTTKRTSKVGPPVLPRKKIPPPPPPKPKMKPKVKAKVKPKPKPEVETVSVYGMQVPVDVKSMKQRIKEELQIVTATRRLHLDEQQELQRMERELEERMRERRLKAEAEAREEAQRKAEAEAKARAEEFRQLRAEVRRKMTPPAATLTSRMSPQASPRRGRHKRQNSDPIVAKFSPIEEDRDIEADIQGRLGVDIAVAASDLSDSLGLMAHTRGLRRFGTITPPMHPELADITLPMSGVRPLHHSLLSKSSELLGKQSRFDALKLTPSQSETCIPLIPRSRTPTYFSDEDDRRIKEEKRHQLQMEIQKRKAR